MPEWSWIFGHLLVLRRYMRKYPSDVFINVVTKEMLYAFPESDMFYLDLWPFASPILCVGEPAAAQQLTSSKHTFPKPPLYRYDGELCVVDGTISNRLSENFSIPSWEALTC